MLQDVGTNTWLLSVMKRVMACVPYHSHRMGIRHNRARIIVVAEYKLLQPSVRVHCVSMDLGACVCVQCLVLLPSSGLAMYIPGGVIFIVPNSRTVRAMRRASDCRAEHSV